MGITNIIFSTSKVKTNTVLKRLTESMAGIKFVGNRL